MGIRITESTVEEAALSWFEGLGYAALNGPDIAQDGLLAERAGFGDVVLAGRLRAAGMWSMFGAVKSFRRWGRFEIRLL